MLFVRPDRPVDPLTIDVLRAIDSTAKKIGVTYFISGATARDILLSNVYGFAVDRATSDIDVAIVVNSWAHFNETRQYLLSTGAFRAGSTPCRIYYAGESDHSGYPIDILPFGSIESPPGIVAWPPHQDSQLNVMGFGEALTSATLIDIGEGLAIPFASLPSLAALKILAWADRGNVTSKDALDLAKLLRCYAGAGNQDRLYSEKSEILEVAGYNLELAGSRLLGLDVCRSLRSATVGRLRQILTDAQSRDKLLLGMLPTLRMHSDPYAAAAALVDQFVTGLTGTP
jgi:predicted nucleotidyltransferase